ncbi:hypothetical protein AB0P37_34060 [Streptomyces antimycoticus]|uniref:hypothetical protein n=1 Tax=Streptomyces antimycoticus TaxID=68175 RepID=UPI00341DEA22
MVVHRGLGDTRPIGDVLDTRLSAPKPLNVLRFTFRDGTTEEDKARVPAAMRRTGALESVAFSTAGQALDAISDLGGPSGASSTG